MYNKTADELKRRIESSVSPFHTVLYVMKELDEAGFERLFLDRKWKLKKGGKYYVNVLLPLFVSEKTGRVKISDLRRHIQIFHVLK